jgi:hypothetical protein
MFAAAMRGMRMSFEMFVLTLDEADHFARVTAEKASAPYIRDPTASGLAVRSPDLLYRQSGLRRRTAGGFRHRSGRLCIVSSGAEIDAAVCRTAH